MSHLHIPDGVLPLWIVGAGWLLTTVLLALALRSPGATVGARLPLLAVLSAFMLVAMTLELVPIGYHVNLTVATGVLLGPALGFLAAFIVNLVLALFGHGGITVVGLNTLVIGAEIALGYHLFRGFRSAMPRQAGPGVVAGIATVVALALGTLLMIGIVGLSNVNPALNAPEAAVVEPAGLSFRNPFGQGVLEWRPFAEERPAAEPRMDLTTFATLVLALGSIGWIVEAFITALVVGYVARMRPDLVPAPPPSRGG